jgi:hypothetical protein
MKEAVQAIIEGLSIHHKGTLFSIGVKFKDNSKKLIDFCEWLGDTLRSTSLEFYIELTSANADYLAKAYITNPQRSGVLYVLSMSFVGRKSFSLPGELLIPERFEDSDLRESALMLRVKYGIKGDGDMKRLSRQLINAHKHNDEFLLNLLLSMAHLSKYDKNVEMLLVALHEDIQAQFSNLLRYLLPALTAALRARNSNLLQKSKWRDLGLPRIS